MINKHLVENIVDNYIKWYGYKNRTTGKFK